jgi:hypothetical protein
MSATAHIISVRQMPEKNVEHNTVKTSRQPIILLGGGSYKFLIETDIPVNLKRLIKLCFCANSAIVRLRKYLSYTFPIKMVRKN